MAIAAVVVAACGLLPEIPSPAPRPTEPPSPSPSPSPTASPSPTPSPSPSPSPAPVFAIHVVAAGDTLSGIARRYDTTLLSIAYWNREQYPSLDPDSGDYQPNRIERGWRLQLLPGYIFEPIEGELPEAPSKRASPSPSA
jgi:hypothetical protein